MVTRRYLAIGSLTVVCGVYFIFKDVKLFRISEEKQFANGRLYRHSTYVPQKRNITCRPLKYAEPPLPVTALVSYPGSGNTWFRHLLQKASGIYTGSVYLDKDLMKGGFEGEKRVDGSVIAVKTHEKNNPEMKHVRIILLMRDPRKAGTAEFKRRHSSHMGQVKPEVLLKDLSGFLEKELPEWISTYVHWLAVKQPLILVEYERLILDPKKEMSKVFAFLKIPVTEDDLECMVRDSEGNFHRQETNQTKPNLSQDYIRKTEEAINMVRNLYARQQQRQ